MNKLKNDLEMDRMVCEMEGYDFDSYINEIQALVGRFRKSN